MLPSQQVIHFERLLVKPKIKSVIQCKNCYRNHPTHLCRSRLLCSKCGKNKHPEEYPNVANCINCKLNHSSLDMKYSYREIRRDCV